MENKRVIVDGYGTWEHFECPLRTDLDTCSVTPGSSINSCPAHYEDDDGAFISDIPDFCPLKNGDVIISLAKDGENEKDS